MSTSIDLSHLAGDELSSLATIVQSVNDAAQGIVQRWLIVGATARDLLLHYRYGMPVRRFTVDVDIAVMVASWQVFAALHRRLINNGAVPMPDMPHRLFVNGRQIDVIPFGGVEQDSVIAFPPDDDVEMNVLGFADASTDAVQVILPGNVSALVASLPSLFILKIIAWEERHRTEPERDGRDLRMLIDSYAEEWNEDRLYEEADDLLAAFGYDNERAAAALLGRDAAAIASVMTTDRVLSALKREASGERLLLAADMGGSAPTNLSLLEAVLFGFQNAAP